MLIKKKSTNNISGANENTQSHRFFPSEEIVCLNFFMQFGMLSGHRLLLAVAQCDVDQ